MLPPPPPLNIDLWNSALFLLSWNADFFNSLYVFMKKDKYSRWRYFVGAWRGLLFRKEISPRSSGFCSVWYVNHPCLLRGKLWNPVCMGVHFHFLSHSAILRLSRGNTMRPSSPDKWCIQWTACFQLHLSTDVTLGTVTLLGDWWGKINNKKHSRWKGGCVVL